MNPTDLQTFVLAAQAGSLSAAADQIGVPKSTVGRRVRRLEADLGISLFDRSSNRAQLTAAGELLRQRASPAFDMLANADAEVRGLVNEPRGRIRITTLSSLGSTDFVTQALLAYRRECPLVTVELDATDRVLDLYDSQIDLALRPLTDADRKSADLLLARRLGPTQTQLYGAPKYLEAHGAPESLEEVNAHINVGHHPVMREPLRMSRAVDTGRSTNAGRATDKGRESQRLKLTNISLWSTSFDSLLHAALAGETLTILPTYLAAPEVARGRLVEVLPEYIYEGAELGIVRPSRRILLPKVSRMLEILSENMLRSGLVLPLRGEAT